MLPLKLVSARGPIESAGAPLVVSLALFAVVSAARGFTLIWLLRRSRHGKPADDGPPTA